VPKLLVPAGSMGWRRIIDRSRQAREYRDFTTAIWFTRAKTSSFDPSDFR